MQIKNLPGMDQYSKLDKAERDNQVKTGKESKTSETASQPASGDRRTVSNEARLYAEAYTSATNAPEIRADRVAALKAQVDSGEYVIDTKDIALKLLVDDSEMLA